MRSRTLLVIASLGLVGGALGCQIVAGLTGNATLGNPNGSGGASSSASSGSSSTSSGTGGTPTCQDGGVPIDCGGGPGCSTCADGQPCMVGTDCQSGVCQTTCLSNYVWAESFGNGAVQQADAVAVDGLGDALVTGKVSGTLNFGNGAQPAASAPSPFLLGLDPTGKALSWSGVFPDTSSMGGEAMAVAPGASGNGGIIAGGFSGSLGFQDGTMITSVAIESPFLVKASNLSNSASGKVFTSTEGMYGQASTGVLVDAAGNTIMIGYVNEIDFGCGSMGYSQAASIFLVKFDPSYNCLWSTDFGGQARAGGTIALDAMGNIVIAGTFTNFPTVPIPTTLVFGNGYTVTTAAEGLTEIFLAKLDAMTGLGMWADSFGDAAGSGGVSGVAVDSAGNVVMTGSFHGTLDFGDGALSALGASAVFVAERDSSGNHLWSKGFGDANVTSATAPVGIAVDLEDKIAIGGQFDGSLDFGGGPLTTMGSTDIFAVRLDSMGNHLWSRSYGDAQTQTSAGIAIAPGGNLILAGNSVSPIDFGGGTVPNSGGTDIFVARLRAP
jgi:hypothetical protein